MKRLIGSVLAALALKLCPKPPIKYEVRTWCGRKVYIHFADTFSEALAWARCYGPDWGITTIWQGGSFVAAINQGDL